MKDALKVIAAVLAAIIVIALIGWGSWAISVALSGPKGQGDAIKQKNSAENWTAKQAEFERLYEGIQTQDKRVAVAKEALTLDPKDKTSQQTLQGVTSACLGLVGEYNALSNEFLAADFKDARLPYKIDTTDPAFDCK